MTYDEAISWMGMDPSWTETRGRYVAAIWTDTNLESFNVGGGPPIPTSRGWRLRLTFDSDTNLLNSWKFYEW